MKMANQGAVTLESVQSIIHDTSLTWKNGNVKESTDLRFTYEEGEIYKLLIYMDATVILTSFFFLVADAGHSEFFMPYIWKMVANSSLIAWYCNVKI
jgi:hypothetical protein